MVDASNSESRPDHGDARANHEDAGAREARALEQLIEVFHDREQALQLAASAGFPVSMMPTFSTPLAFWTKVVQQARNGVLPSGLRPLIEAAARMYPHNASFAGAEPVPLVPDLSTASEAAAPRPGGAVSERRFHALQELSVGSAEVRAAPWVPTAPSPLRIAAVLLVLLGVIGLPIGLCRFSGENVDEPDPVADGAQSVSTDDEPGEAGLRKPLGPPPKQYSPFEPRSPRGTMSPRAAGVMTSGDPDQEVPLEQLLPPRPWLLDKGGIVGRVHDGEGRALAGAWVCTWPYDPRVPIEERRKIKCDLVDRRGRFEITEVAPGFYDVFASAPGFRPGGFVAHHDHPLVVQPGQRREGVEFGLEPGGVEVRGIVEDAAAGPIEGARVASLGPAQAIAIADDKGAFTLWVAEGDFEIFAWADGYADLVTDRRRGAAETDGGSEGPEGSTAAAPSGAGSGLEASDPRHAHEHGPEPLVLVLHRESVLMGRVVDEQSGHPVENARVRAGAIDGGIDPLVYTDEQGEFMIGALPAGKYQPSARTEDGHGKAREPTEILAGWESAEVKIRLRALVPETEFMHEGSTGKLEIDEGETGRSEGEAASTGGSTDGESTDGESIDGESGDPPDDRPLPPRRVRFARRLRRCGTDGTIEVRAEFVLESGKLFLPEVIVTGNAGRDPQVKKCARKLAENFKFRRRKDADSFRTLTVQLWK